MSRTRTKLTAAEKAKRRARNERRGRIPAERRPASELELRSRRAEREARGAVRRLKDWFEAER